MTVEFPSSFSPVLDRLHRACKVNSMCVLAVSGGSDSMALLRLVHDYNQTHSTFQKIIVATVDHGLRSESAREAKQVATWCEALEIEHVTLHWEGTKPHAGIQKKAREARYEALLKLCKTRGARYLMTAHHQGDQLETFFLRLFKGSGVQGLCSMLVQQEIDGITLLRPLLAVPKRELEAYLDTLGQDYIRDPSNENTDFERVKLRRMIEDLRAQKFHVDAIAKSIEHMQEQTAFINRLLDYYRPLIVQDLTFNGKAFCSLDVFLQQTLLRDILWELSHKDYPPKFTRVETIRHTLHQQKNFTFSGYNWRFKGEHYVLQREKRTRPTF